MTFIVLAAVLYLAFANGSNDNLKGVATLYGAKTVSYRQAVGIATAAQVAGSLLALLLAAQLVQTFSAKGLVPDAVATSPSFLAAAALAAASTVMLATLLGLPVSTTHALTGALIGVGVVAVGSGINLAVLGKSFFLPLLVSPFCAVALAMAAYPLARRLRAQLGVRRESCVCIGEEWVPAVASNCSALSAERVRLALATGAGCADRYQGRFIGISVQQGVDALHFVSGAAVCFARALNDTPKIVALLLAAGGVGQRVGLASVAAAMALGGLVGARKVTETMASKVTSLTPGQGLVSSLGTALLVLGASRFGLPVSTTHVATGGLFGIGAVTGQARSRTVLSILAAWVTTLPLGAALGMVAFFFLRALS